MNDKIFLKFDNGNVEFNELDVNWKNKNNNFTNENFKELIYRCFFITFCKLLIDFA
jgi:hypothetical protein